MAAPNQHFLAGAPYFMHVGFAFVDGFRDMTPAIDAPALDWVRYSSTNFIVWTVVTPHVWLARLRPHMGPNDQVFICKLDVRQRSGWLPQFIWDWITAREPHF